MNVRPGTKEHACVVALRDGPGTTEEIAIETNAGMRATSARLQQLFARGIIHREVFFTGLRTRGRTAQRWLYSLAEPT